MFTKSTPALLLLTLLAPASATSAGPLILAEYLVVGCHDNQPTLTIQLDPTTFNFYKGGLYFHFNPPSPSPIHSQGVNPVILDIPTSFQPGSTQVLWISTSANGGSSSMEYPFELSTCCGGSAPVVPRGMTWRKLKTHPVNGTIDIGCGGQCDAYNGDTPCDQKWPILCIYKPTPAFAPPPGIDNSNKYHRWSGGIVGTTKAMAPPATLAEADQSCVDELGAGWRVAEFHDGWGWSLQAYGNVGDPTQRVWLHINDQPKATCWVP